MDTSAETAEGKRTAPAGPAVARSLLVGAGIVALVAVTARLDWPARAEFGDETRVFLYDPGDRGVLRTWRSDRVH